MRYDCHVPEMVDLFTRGYRVRWSLLFCRESITAYINSCPAWRVKNSFSSLHTCVLTNLLTVLFTLFPLSYDFKFLISTYRIKQKILRLLQSRHRRGLSILNRLCISVRLKVLMLSISRLIVMYRVGRLRSAKRVMQISCSLSSFVRCF